MLQVICGHVDSPANSMWNELNFLDYCTGLLLSEQLDDLLAAPLSLEPRDITILCDDISNVLTDKSFIRRPQLRGQKKSLDLNHLRDNNVMDELWNIIKG